MPSPVYRGDNPGFQTQAVGNYPDASDVADKDNIFLTDQGWVYRHFKNLAGTEFWDEIIWAGDVTNPPSENNPVDAMNAVSPTYLVGDGVQAISGPYEPPAPGVAVSFSGNTTITGTAQVGQVLTITAANYTGGKGTVTTNLILQSSANGTSGWAFLVGNPGEPGGGTETYTILPAQEGEYIRASFQVTDDDGTVSNNSSATAVIIAA